MKNRKLAKQERRIARKEKGKPSSQVKQLKYENRVNERREKEKRQKLEKLLREKKSFESDVTKLLTEYVVENNFPAQVRLLNVPVPDFCRDLPSVKVGETVYSCVGIENDIVIFKKIRRSINCGFCDNEISLDIDKLALAHKSISSSILSGYEKDKSLTTFSVIVERDEYTEYVVSSHKRILRSGICNFEIEDYEFADLKVLVKIRSVPIVRKSYANNLSSFIALTILSGCWRKI